MHFQINLILVRKKKVFLLAYNYNPAGWFNVGKYNTEE